MSPPQSFSNPRTHYHIVRSDTPVDVDGFKIGEPTGEIECCECGESHLNIDEIPHDDNCSQRFVKSDFWAQHFLGN